MVTKIKFKQTTNDKCCKKCGNSLKGENGYVEIQAKGNKVFSSYTSEELCFGCFDDIYNGIKSKYEDTENKKLNYERLLKRRVLNSL